jgi:hypothetical protein
MALTGATFGPAVLAPLTRYLHFARLPDGPAETGRPVPAPPFARVLRALLASSLRSALRIAGPKAAPACSKPSVRVVEKGTFARGADASAAAKGLSAALRLLRWARSLTQGCVRQFGAGQDGQSPNDPSARRESRRYRASGARTARDAVDVSEPAADLKHNDLTGCYITPIKRGSHSDNAGI